MFTISKNRSASSLTSCNAQVRFLNWNLKTRTLIWPHLLSLLIFNIKIEGLHFYTKFYVTGSSRSLKGFNEYDGFLNYNLKILKEGLCVKTNILPTSYFKKNIQLCTKLLLNEMIREYGRRSLTGISQKHWFLLYEHWGGRTILIWF